MPNGQQVNVIDLGLYIDMLFIISLATDIQKGTLKIATFQKGNIYHKYSENKFC